MKKFFLTIKDILSDTYEEFIDDKALKMSAALSFYTLFSLSPLLLITISIAGALFGEEAARGEIVAQIQNLIGNEGAQIIETIIKNASETDTSIFATIISVVILVLGSLGVFLELKESLDIIWGVELKTGRGLIGLLKTRISSFVMVIGTGFLLMVSLILSAALSAFNKFIGESLSSYIVVIEIISTIFLFILFTILFAMIFKILPDAYIKWKYVWIGAIGTSLLFTIGKYLIGLYIGNSSYASSFGAAGSIIVLLVWLNYSSMILFFGAEFSQILRKRYSKTPLKPIREAIIVPKVTDLIREGMKNIKNIPTV
jgi:membrane protein